MAWSQHTIALGKAAQGDDVTDLHLGGIDHNAVDQQLDEGATLVERGLLKASGDGSAEGFQPAGEAVDVRLMCHLSGEPLLLAAKVGQLLLQVVPSRLQLRKRQRLRHVGIDQALDLPRHVALAAPDIALAGQPLVTSVPALLRPSQRVLQHRRFRHQVAEVLPHGRVQTRGGDQPG